MDMRMSKGKGKEKDEDYLQVRLPTAKRPFNAVLYGDMVQAGLARLYGDLTLSDVTLVVADEKIPVHRIVLNVWSDTFRALLESAGTNREVAIPLDKEDVADFKLMLKHMYTGDTDFITGENVLSLMSLSSYFNIHSLKETCGELLGETVSDDNLFFFLDVVDKYEVRALEAACGSHLAEHFHDLITSGKLDDLEPSTWAEIVKTDDIRVHSEEELFEAVLRYTNQFKGKEERDHALNTILPYIRFPFMTPRFLVTKVEAEESIKHLPVVQDLLHEAYRYRVNPSSVKNIRSTPRTGQRFDPQQCDSNLTLSDDKLTLTLNSTNGGWYNASCASPLTPSQPYIEFKVVSGSAGQLMIGVVAGTCATSGYAGQYSNGWTYYSSGQVYNSSNTPATGQSYNAGDRIGVFVEFDKKTVHFFKNGKSSTSVSGVTFSDNNPLYPNVSANANGNSVTVIPYAPLPAEAQAKVSKDAATSSRKNRAKLTTSSLGRAYGDEGEVPSVEPPADAAAEAIDGTTFIKRFLRFRL